MIEIIDIDIVSFDPLARKELFEGSSLARDSNPRHYSHLSARLTTRPTPIYFVQAPFRRLKYLKGFIQYFFYFFIKKFIFLVPLPVPGGVRTRNLGSKSRDSNRYFTRAPIVLHYVTGQKSGSNIVLSCFISIFVKFLK